ncbi:long-chain-fatty-acid--CoA ligase [Piscinibacter sakaiensis]|uniref:Long-chain-fatty-acid--CoA ligase n=1 Tax=Piscinibacter sakaiensis TaxID=1547922 RepID=A0A0K8P3D7_PISS1|nr:long-chain-fatty-acid--CoA ligase [Piscinibacter sakaiensis]
MVMAASGDQISFAELDARTNQGAHLLRALGMRPGDHIAVLMENHLRFYEVYWAAMTTGLYFTPISTHLSAAEAAYIVQDCGARMLVSSAAMRDLAGQVRARCPQLAHGLAVDAAFDGFDHWEAAIARQPSSPVEDAVGGHHMMYSSGTTGQPKGIKVPFAGNPIGKMAPIMEVFAQRLAYDDSTVYLSPAPLYHAAPLGFSTAVQRMGGTVIVMEKFDPAAFLALVERYKVTHTQVVPTMFVRMLKLPPEVRARHDLSSLTCALHAAAPCPVDVKQQMIDWWGPCIVEQYSGSEGSGCTLITSEEWLTHRGSVGRALMNTVRIVGEDGRLQPPGATGTIYFEGSRRFAYHNDAAKTESAFNAQGWSTLGDIGYLDEEGYLYLTDRKAYMIISGGVNIYPQESEGVLTLHPKVVDVAVFGVPNAEFGEEVKAVVQPIDMADAGPALEAELIAYCRAHLAAFKCPRSVDFEAQLPRQDNGKLYKRLLRDRYWAGKASRVI